MTDETSTGKLKITLKKSVIGYRESQRLTVQSLGLRRIRQSVIQHDTPGIRGMIHKVSHLVTVEEVAADTPMREETGSQRFQARREKRVAEREAWLTALGLLEGEEAADEESDKAQA